MRGRAGRGRRRGRSSSSCGGSGGGRRSLGTRGLGSGLRLGFLLNRVDVVIDLLRILVVAEDLALDGLGGIVGFILGGQGALRHYTEGLGRADLDDALGGLLGEEDILRLNPPDGRGELVGKKLDQEGMGEFLFDFGTHFGGGGDGFQKCGVGGRR